jgi:hypothetical protein
MAYGKRALGKIFISHSSKDKDWVRRFDKRLRQAGYDTWLDEREIEIGDALAASISQGLRNAKIVVVVVSAASLASKWLRYELDIATERMVNGHCRVLPVLIDDVEVPPELAGRLWADCRPGRRVGMKSILHVLDLEADKYPEPTSPATMDSPDAWVRTRAYEDFLGSLSGGWWSGSMELSATRDIDLEGVNIGGRDVIVDVVTVYSQREELSEHDYEDWTTRVLEELNETCGLLITEKPPTDKLRERLNIEDRIGAQPSSGLFQPSGLLLVADLSEDLSDDHARDILRRAHERLKVAIDEATPPLIDPASVRDSAE